MCFSVISELNPDKLHGDLANAAARQRFRSDGKRRPVAHDACVRTEIELDASPRPSPNGAISWTNNNQAKAGV